jgi:hypothetical protein
MRDLKVHRGVYEKNIFGGRIFIYAFTKCSGQVWYKTTSNPRKVTCKNCRRMRDHASS